MHIYNNVTSITSTQRPLPKKTKPHLDNNDYYTSVLKKYSEVCGNKVIKNLIDKAKLLNNKHILMLNSTYQGGGVAEILNSLIFLFNVIGVKVGWRILHGTEDFFTVTKKIHNALQGEKINLSTNKKQLYFETNRKFAAYTHINHDLVVIHDPQPLPLIEFYEKTQPWIFRCHIDLSHPDQTTLNYLKKFIGKYDRIVVSKQEYLNKDLHITIPHFIVPPAIDPLSVKNKPLSDNLIAKILHKYNISTRKPIIAQISRFDKWKDPLGVLKIFELVREKFDCSLVLLGSLAIDDPEGSHIYTHLQQEIAKSKYSNDIKILMVASDLLVNCLQRAATIIIQKSLREGFGLVVSEALYKGAAVIASNAGGIPLQIINNKTGLLVEPNDIQGFVDKTLLLLNDNKLRHKLGKHGIAHIKNNFLITRLIDEWLDIFISLIHPNS